MDTSALLRCYFAFVLPFLEYCCIVRLNLICSCSSARCIRWPGFALIRLSFRCVVVVMLLHCLCCTRLIRTKIIVCSESFHLLLSEFDITERRPQLIHSSLKYQGVERPNLQGVCCRPRLVCGITYPTMCLTGTLDGFKGGVNRLLLH